MIPVPAPTLMSLPTGNTTTWSSDVQQIWSKHHLDWQLIFPALTEEFQ